MASPRQALAHRVSSGQDTCELRESFARVLRKHGLRQPGTYSVDYYGTLWVKLNNGKIYSAALAAEYPNRFDLIESDTLVPTVFEKVPPQTNAAGFAKGIPGLRRLLKSRGPQG